MDTTGLTAAQVSYATLSHCWGNTGCIKTTPDTIAKHMGRIEYDDLPKSFQDAIRIARACKIPYIWIDSLCILQGDVPDWERESARMADIFQGSSLTIAATDAPDAHGGCAIDPPKYDETAEFQARIDEDCTRFWMHDPDRDMKIQVRLQVSNVLLRVNQSALNSRGWVLQEVVLSSRLLHCTRQELYWKCRCRCESEMGMTYVPFSPRHKLPRLRSDHLDEAIGTWYKWVQNYTPRRFSKKSDRVPALAGITRYYQSVTGDEPILGLWRRTLLRDLEWRPVKGGRVHPTDGPPFSGAHDIPGVPTWTWLSCPGSIDFGFGPDLTVLNAHSVQHATLESYGIEWQSEPLTSPIIDARLNVKGPMVRLSFELRPPDPDSSDSQQDFKIAGANVSARVQLHFDRDIAMNKIDFQCFLLRSIADGATMSEVFLLLTPHVDGRYVRAGLGCITSELMSSGLFDHTSLGEVSLA